MQETYEEPEIYEETEAYEMQETYEYSSISRRLGAFAIDSVLIATLELSIYLLGRFFSTTPIIGFFFHQFSMLILFLFPLIYYSKFTASKLHATPGQTVLNMEVINTSKYYLFLPQSTFRAVTFIFLNFATVSIIFPPSLDSLFNSTGNFLLNLFIFLISCLVFIPSLMTMTRSKERFALHDFITKTRVITIKTKFSNNGILEEVGLINWIMAIRVFSTMAIILYIIFLTPLGGATARPFLTNHNNNDSPLHSKGYSGCGSGFFINKTDLITNDHVVALSLDKTFMILDKAGNTYPATVIAKDGVHDLAALRISNPESRKTNLSLVFRKNNNLNIGDKLLVPDYTNKAGVYKIKTAKLKHIVDNKNDFYFSAQSLRKGNSGSALLDKNGLIVGVNKAGGGGVDSDNILKQIGEMLLLYGYGIATDIKTTKHFLEINNIPYRTITNDSSSPINNDEYKEHLLVNVWCKRDPFL